MVVGIIVVVLAVIGSNLLLLRDSANTKFGSKLTDANRKQAPESDTDEEPKH